MYMHMGYSQNLLICFPAALLVSATAFWVMEVISFQIFDSSGKSKCVLLSDILFMSPELLPVMLISIAAATAPSGGMMFKY